MTINVHFKFFVSLVFIFLVAACQSEEPATLHPASSREEQPRIEIQPKEPLFDEIVTIRLYGFEPESQVTLRARTQDDDGQTWESYASFETDQNGFVDISSQIPISGTYESADPMGLFWSMKLQYLDENTINLFSDYKTSPRNTLFTAKIDGKEVTKTVLKRLRGAGDILEIAVDENGLLGILYLPDGEGPFPTVIVLWGSGGGIDPTPAIRLAAHGYATFALAYFDAGNLPKELVEIPLEYFGTAIDWLQTQEAVDTDRLAVLGSSRGGELALLLGATYPEIKTVIGYVPSGFVIPGLSKYESETPKPAWTLNGEAIPYVSEFTGISTRLAFALEDFISHDGFGAFLFANMSKNPNLQPAIIPVEKINGPVLLISGEDDQLWASTLLSEIAMYRLRQHDFPYPYEHLRYPGAGHMIRPPYTPVSTGEFTYDLTGESLNNGGNPSDTAFANQDAWKHVLQFLDEYLASKTNSSK